VERSDMISLDELPQVIRQVEELARNRERAKGRHDEVRARIRQRFGCKTTKEAKKLLRRKQEERTKAFRAYSAFLDKFKKEWKHVLEEV
jgi:molybdopterin synthase catalytic subunit